MNDKSKEYKLLAPYVPFKTFMGFLEKLNQTTVPPAIDTSLLSSLSGSMQSQLKSALRFLNLIDNSGAVKDKLHVLVRAYKTEDWQESLAETISDAYNGVVGDVDLDTGTSQMLAEAFRKRGGVDGQMLDKALRFYLSALSEAGLSFSPHFKERRKPRAGRGSTRKKKKQTRKKAAIEETTEDEIDDLDKDGDGGERVKFKLPILNGGDAIILIPRSISKADWEMLKVQLDAFVERLASGGE